MTAKDFTVIAAIIQQMPDHERRVAALRFTNGLRLRFPKFDDVLFLKACGFTKEEASALHGVA
jgi:hypothetical protein